MDLQAFWLKYIFTYKRPTSILSNAPHLFIPLYLTLSAISLYYSALWIRKILWTNTESSKDRGWNQTSQPSVPPSPKMHCITAPQIPNRFSVYLLLSFPGFNLIKRFGLLKTSSVKKIRNPKGPMILRLGNTSLVHPTKWVFSSLDSKSFYTAIFLWIICFLCKLRPCINFSSNSLSQLCAGEICFEAINNIAVKTYLLSQQLRNWPDLCWSRSLLSPHL